jgi:hypothetical protein
MWPAVAGTEPAKYVDLRRVRRTDPRSFRSTMAVGARVAADHVAGDDRPPERSAFNQRHPHGGPPRCRGAAHCCWRCACDVFIFTVHRKQPRRRIPPGHHTRRVNHECIKRSVVARAMTRFGRFLELGEPCVDVSNSRRALPGRENACSTGLLNRRKRLIGGIFVVAMWIATGAPSAADRWAIARPIPR